MNKKQLIARSIIISCLIVFSSMIANGQNNTAGQNKKIQLLTKALELVSSAPGAEKCKDQKGVTLKLRVVSETAVDVMRYLNISNVWRPALFSNLKKGEEILDYSCRTDSPFRFYSRPAGSTEKFPKPE